MKKALPFSAPRKTVLLLVLTAVLLTAVFCSLTFVRFSSQLYIKRSPNTFVGDEKYLENRAVVEQELETLRSQGVDGEIAEEGPPDDLLARGGVYYKLYKLQSEAMKKVLSGM